MITLPVLYRLQLPSYTQTQISSLFCHQSPPVRCWSCDNSNIHTTGFQSLPVRYWATVTLIHTHRFPHYFVTDSHRSGIGHVTSQIYILQGSRAYQSGTGLQLPPYTHRFPHYFVTNSHQSSTGHVTTQTQGLSRSGTGYSCPYRLSH